MGAIKYIVITVFCCSFFVGASQDLEAIPWTKSRKLTWADFKRKPKKGSENAAVTASGISYSFSSLARGNEVEADFKIGAYFYPTQSWYQAEFCDDVVLSHEQLHFDIAELFARKFKSRVEKLTFSLNIKKEVKKVYNEILKELNDFQDLYDWETNFSRNTAKQLEWNEKIKDSLLE